MSDNSNSGSNSDSNDKTNGNNAEESPQATPEGSSKPASETGTPGTDELGLPIKPQKNRGGLFVALGTLALVAAVILGIVLVQNNSSQNAAAPNQTKVRIGVTDASKPYWKTFKEIAASEGIELETVNFNDYHQANPALQQKQIDANLFQHLLFLADYNVSNNDTLTPVGSTYVVPLSLYSQKHPNVAAIPQGGTVAVPKDATNQARALLVLQQAGLIKLNNGGNVLSTPADVDTAASKVRVVPVDAAQTVTSLPSVDGAIVNNNFALDAGLDPTTALYGDDPNSPASRPYINAIVVRAEDKNNPTLHKLVDIYRDKRVADQVQAEARGTSVLVNRPQPELEGILSELTTTVREGK